MPGDLETRVVAHLILTACAQLIRAVWRFWTADWILDRWRLLRWGFLHPNKQRVEVEKDILFVRQHPQLVRRITSSGGW
jgi:hypothetical protein